MSEKNSAVDELGAMKEKYEGSDNSQKSPVILSEKNKRKKSLTQKMVCDNADIADYGIKSNVKMIYGLMGVK